MMKKGTKKPVTLYRLMWEIWISMFVLFLAVSFLLQTAVAGNISKRLEKSIRSNVEITEQGIEDTLEMADQYFYESYYANTSTSISSLISRICSSEDPLERLNAQQELGRTVAALADWSDVISFCMLYTEREEEGNWYDAGTRDDYCVRKEIKNGLQDGIDQSFLKDGKSYYVMEGASQTYALRVMRLDRAIVILGVSENVLLTELQKAFYSDDSLCFVLDETGSCIADSFPISVSEAKLSPENDGNYVRMQRRKYLQSGCTSSMSGYYYGILTDYSAIRRELLPSTIVMVLGCLLMSVILVVEMLLLSRNIEKPLKRITGTMKAVENGDFSAEAEADTNILEFRDLLSSFNHMTGKIQSLKIQQYETELDLQKQTMQYLQLQVRPHFFANILNIIYALAQTGDYATIQKLSRAVANFSRYRFRDMTELVELEREYECVQNYMDIQDIRYRKMISLEWDVDPKLESALLPPFLIQSFVENSVKYAFSTQKEGKIRISIMRDPTGETMVLTIRDNGNGYPEDMLDGSWKEKPSEGHIGLQNNYQRLQMIYGEKAKITLENRGGAAAVITLPYISLDFSDDTED